MSQARISPIQFNENAVTNIAPVDILAFSPHPDDVELGCGGSLILATREGLRVMVADLSAAEMSSRGTVVERAAEAATAAELLGLAGRVKLGLPDTQLGTDPAHRQAVIRLVRTARPRLVLAPYWRDRHPEHEAASTLIREACFYAGVGKLDGGPPHRPAQLCYYMIHTPFEPSFVVDVSAVWEQRMMAVRAYASQFQPAATGAATALSHSDFLQYVEARAITYGAMIGAAYGEPFALRGPVPMPGLSGLLGDDQHQQTQPLPYRPF
jgi:bacillithiol biosynthesis deacetylase BshB1